MYRKRADGKVNYDMFLFRDPGLMRVLRYKMFNWGVGSMQKIIDAQIKLQQSKANAKIYLKEKKELASSKASSTLEKAKQKLPKRE